MDPSHASWMSERVAALAELPPGPRLAAALTGVDPEVLDAADLVVLAKAWERQRAFCEAEQLTVFAYLVGQEEYQQCTAPQGGALEHDSEVGAVHVHDPIRVSGTEVSLALGVAPGAARDLVYLADELFEVMPSVLSAMYRGRIDRAKARALVEGTRCLTDPALRRSVADVVLPAAAALSARQLRRRVAAAVIAADPAAAHARRRSGVTQRRVTRPEPYGIDAADGIAEMVVTGPAEDLVALSTALDAAAQAAKAGGDQRGAQQLRFDTLTGLGWTALDLRHLGCCSPGCVDGHTLRLAGGRGRAAHVQVTVSAETLVADVPDRTGDAPPGSGSAPVGSSDAPDSGDPPAAPAGSGDAPAVLAGFGPVPGAAARRIAGWGGLRRLITDPVEGRVLDYGRTTYAAPAELVAKIIARDVTCRLATCEVPALGCDLDHRRPYGRGGTTSEANEWALCRGHHLDKTHHGFTLHVLELADAASHTHTTTAWRTPAGHLYPIAPGDTELIVAKTPPAKPPDEPPPF